MATDRSTPGDMIVDAKQQIKEIIDAHPSASDIPHLDIIRIASGIKKSVNLDAAELKDLKDAVDAVRKLLGGPNTTDEARLGIYKHLVDELDKAEKKVSGGRRRRPSKKTRKSRKSKRSMRTRKIRRGGDLRGTLSAAAAKAKEKAKALKEKVASQFRPDDDPFTATGDYDTDMGVNQ